MDIKEDEESRGVFLLVLKVRPDCCGFHAGLVFGEGGVGVLLSFLLLRVGVLLILYPWFRIWRFLFFSYFLQI